MSPLKTAIRTLGPLSALLASLTLGGWAKPSLDRGPAEASSKAGARLFARTQGLSPRTFQLALRAYRRAILRGETSSPLLTVIDYGLPSTRRRLWVLDLARDSVLFHELVAHGQGSGENRAVAFSNRMGSHKSSLGVFLTGGTYQGRNGYSLRLRGLEPGINDRAENRAIVIHGAPYVSHDFARRFGRLGRSQGCPALRPEVAGRVIDTIREGSVVFAYFPDPKLERASKYLRSSSEY